MTPRAQNLVAELRGRITATESQDAVTSRTPVRYTPITESYRSIVDLSSAIARQKPLSSMADGRKDVLGVLIDVAEVWELYLYHLLRSALHGVEVVHAGRKPQPEDYLLRSTHSGARLGVLKPDILVRTVRGGRCVAVLDAKYKTTTPSPERPRGILREDLYQMTSYLAAYGDPDAMLNGALVYPIGKKAASIQSLQAASPWQLSAAQRGVWFMGLRCEDDSETKERWTREELVFLGGVREMLEFASSLSHRP